MSRFNGLLPKLVFMKYLKYFGEILIAKTDKQLILSSKLGIFCYARPKTGHFSWSAMRFIAFNSKVLLEVWFGQQPVKTLPQCIHIDFHLMQRAVVKYEKGTGW
jgi:hypothetical protein